MKNSLFVLAGYLIVCTACTNELENSNKIYFYTQDSLYKISFDKPIELDTFYSWLDDDNACSDEHKYRFSKKNFPPQKETGFFWTSYADSTYRITVKHVEKFNCKLNMDYEKIVTPEEYKQRLLKKAEYDHKPIKITYIKEIKIDNKQFLLSAYRVDEKYKNGYWTDYIKASTIVDSNMIVFTADCRANNCKEFIGRMEKTLKTIKIEKE